jgi:hypothetical protein
MTQRLLRVKFGPPGKTVGGHRKAIPQEVDFERKNVERVWTLMSDPRVEPALPIRPVHNSGAFLEDYMHDWNIWNGKFHYYSRVMDRDTWVLIELKA